MESNFSFKQIFPSLAIVVVLIAELYSLYRLVAPIQLLSLTSIKTELRNYHKGQKRIYRYSSRILNYFETIKFLKKRLGKAVEQ